MHRGNLKATMEHPIQVLHHHHGEGDQLDSSNGPAIGASLLGQWHAFRGRPIRDELNMEYHRQLDHVAVWIDRWSHEQVCDRIYWKSKAKLVCT